MNLTPERWQRVAELFAVVKDLRPAEVNPYLRVECGEDHELEGEILSLVEYHRSGADLPAVNRVLPRDLFADASVPRTFTAGSTFGPYTIRGLLGSGGMGDVYLADDTRLRRKVALKVLPGWLNGQPDLVARFTREALAASGLNHPHVPAVYEAGEIDDRHYIAAEYVDGSPLTSRIADGAVPWREAIALTLQVADALGAAHAAGIVHRDVKPGNILVGRDDCRVRLVDFGIAKPVTGVEPQSPIRDFLTRPGVVIGTPGYMAPEQAAGLNADGRSDIWSLAAVLHEMVTGRLPAPGSTTVQVSSNVPSALARVLERALQPDPSQRYQSVSEFAAALSRAQRTAVQAPWIPGICGAAVTVLLGVSIYSFLRTPRQAEPGFRVGQIKTLTTNGKVQDAIISPDSRFVIYSVEESGRQSLRLLQVDTGADIERIPYVEGKYAGLSFTPDGNYFYYTFDPHGDVRDLYQAPVIPGSPPRKIVEDLDSPPAVSPDGQSLAWFRGNPSHKVMELHISDSDGSHDRIVDSRPATQFFLAAAWSQDGTQIYSAAYDERRKVSLTATAKSGGQSRLLSKQEWNWIGRMSLLNDGQTLVFPVTTPENPTAELVQFSLKTLRSKAITSDLAKYQNAYSAGTDIVTVRQHRLSSVWIAPVSAPASATPVTEPAGHYDSVVWASDGTLISNIAEDGRENLWRLSRSGARQQLTSGPFIDAYPSVSPGGSQIAFATNRAGGWSIWTTSADGHATQPLTSGQLLDQSPSFAPDGTILYGHQADGRFHIWRTGRAGGSPVQVMDTPAYFPAVSASGTHMICRMLDKNSGKWQVAVVDLPGLKEIKKYPMIPLDTQVKWFPREMALTWVRVRNGVSNIRKLPLATGLEEPVTDFRDGTIFSLDWSPTTPELAMVRGIAASDVILIRRAN